MERTTGERIGPYELLQRVGAGGMGEVYTARDTRLDRIVAIKFSKEQFSERFEHEAKAVASLNHPHVCQLYDVGPDYLVMEYVDGSELKGPMPAAKAIELGSQILDALDAAHRKGIVHRDLKPANVMVTKSGVKVLDFGLAKIQTQPSFVAEAVTAVSVEGSISGTLYYMAPEQLAGKAEIDSRADLFAFGCVLYEMLTGKRAFDGSNAASVIAAIMERQAPTIEDAANPALDRVLKKCLEKDPENRWQNARDLKQNLLWASQNETTAPLQRQTRPALWMGATAVFALFAAAVSVLHFREKPAQMPVVTTSIFPPENTTLDPFAIAVSPDGQRIAFRAGAGGNRDAKGQLWIRSLNSAVALPLAGTEDASGPFWSPDGQSIGFFAGRKLNRIDAAGGTVVAVIDATNASRGASWGSEGFIVYAPSNTTYLRKIRVAGGMPTDATKLGPGESSHRWPWFLPDGKHFIFAAGRAGLNREAIRVGSLDSTESKKLFDADSGAVYSSGYLLFLRGDALMAQPFDTALLTTSGEAVPISENVLADNGGLGAFQAASNLLVYTKGSAFTDLTWFDRTGQALSRLGEPGAFNGVSRSPDGKSVALTMQDKEGNIDIWISDVKRGVRARLTSDPAVDQDPTWSPDSKTIVFASSRKGHSDIYRKAVDGSGVEELLFADDRDKYPDSISPDGKFLLFEQANTERRGEVWVMPDPLGVAGRAKPYPFLQTRFTENSAEFSPDGHWIVYNSNESGRVEVYVTAFPGPGGKRQVSTAGGQSPHWRADGKEIFYRAGAQLTAVAVELKSSELQTSEPHQLFRTEDSPLITAGASLDGQRFLVPTVRVNSVDPLTIVQNWAAALKK